LKAGSKAKINEEVLTRQANLQDEADAEVSALRAHGKPLT